MLRTLNHVLLICLVATTATAGPTTSKSSTASGGVTSETPISSSAASVATDVRKHTVALDMDCHKTGASMKQHEIDEPHNMGGMKDDGDGDDDDDTREGEDDDDAAFPKRPFHPIVKRDSPDFPSRPVGIFGRGKVSTSSPATTTDDFVEVTMGPREEESLEAAVKALHLPEDICDLAKDQPQLNLSAVPTVNQVDPMLFTVAEYPCRLTGFSRVMPMHSDCQQVGDHEVFHGHFVYHDIVATCDCGHNMTDFRWMVEVHIANASLHCRIHEHKNGRFMFFYDPATYSHYSEVDAPIGKAHQIQSFLELFHHELRAHFEMGFAHMANEIMKIVKFQWAKQ